MLVRKVTNYYNYVLDKKCKGIQKVCDPITERFFRAPGPRTKYLERLLLSFNKLYTDITRLNIQNTNLKF